MTEFEVLLAELREIVSAYVEKAKSAQTLYATAVKAADTMQQMISNFAWGRFNQEAKQERKTYEDKVGRIQKEHHKATETAQDKEDALHKIFNDAEMALLDTGSFGDVRPLFQQLSGLLKAETTDLTDEPGRQCQAALDAARKEFDDATAIPNSTAESTSKAAEDAQAHVVQGARATMMKKCEQLKQECQEKLASAVQRYQNSQVKKA